jgi:ABC-type multidrug transport system fused ATPase/permease subunit
VQESASASDQKAIKEKKKGKRSRKKQLVQEEERVRGRVNMKVYLSYMAAAYKGLLIPLIILAQSLFQFLQIASSWWMAWANPQMEGGQPRVSPMVLLGVYMALAFGSSWFIFVRAVLVATFGLAAAQKLFLKMLSSVFRAPMSFFDSTPAGRILNRVSTSVFAGNICHLHALHIYVVDDYFLFLCFSVSLLSFTLLDADHSQSDRCQLTKV